MAGDKRGTGRRYYGASRQQKRTVQGIDRQDATVSDNISCSESRFASFFRAHALSAILFLISFFFIITITNPGLYINDEWITANQLHQIDIGHQVIINEGKYGVLENGTATSYFSSRQNVLMYSLALPLAALPFVRLFGLLGDNFRMLIILAWSLSLVSIALLLDAYYPKHAKIFGIRIFFPAVLFSLLLFTVNILLYKQFPFSAPDAPFEVAALVLANHVFFALTVVIIFEIFQAIQQDVWLSLFGTIACTACSSYLFWAGTGKDHMLAATIFAFVIFFFVLYLINGRRRDAGISFVFCGLLIWVRPEVGFFVTVFSGALYGVPLFLPFFRKKSSVRNLALSLVPMAGAFIGGIPFFINNLITTHNLLIPVFDLPRQYIEAGIPSRGSLPLQELTNNIEMINQTGSLGAGATIVRVGEIISSAILKGFSFDNVVQGLSGVMFFPKNGHIGFLIMCPIVLIAIIAFLLWHTRVLDIPEKRRDLYLFFLILGFAAIFSYLPKLWEMNISSGILPDMRYLTPAYIPFGILSIMVLSRTPILKKPREMLFGVLVAALVLTPVLFLLMIVVHPFGAINEGYTLFFEVVIVGEMIIVSVLMILSRFFLFENHILLRLLPWSLILILITVFTFQLVLVFIFGVIVKMNGYPLWIPLIRESFRVFFSVTILPPA
jgi:hypothetical protein